MDMINAVLFHTINFADLNGKVAIQPKNVRIISKNGSGKFISLDTTPQNEKMNKDNSNIKTLVIFIEKTFRIKCGLQDPNEFYKDEVKQPTNILYIILDSWK